MLEPLEPEQNKEGYFCKRCAAKVEKGSKFCGKCGNPIKWRQPNPKPVAGTTEPEGNYYENQTPIQRARSHYIFNEDKIADAWLAHRDKITFVKGNCPKRGRAEFVEFLRNTPIIERVEDDGTDIVAYLRKDHENCAFEDVPQVMANR